MECMARRYPAPDGGMAGPSDHRSISMVVELWGERGGIS